MRVKTQLEIKKIKKALTIAEQALLFARGRLSRGVTERETAKLIRAFMRGKGAKESFRTIVAFGRNAAEIHHRPTDRKLKAGDCIVIDLGAKIDDYCSDVTRTFFFKKVSRKLKGIYEVVLKAQKKAINLASPGISAGSLDLASRNVIRREGYGKFFIHALGHSIGKKVHERPSMAPNIDYTLVSNNVFCIEPGIYIQNIGGVRIEDMILITKGGNEILSKIPKDLRFAVIK